MIRVAREQSQAERARDIHRWNMLGVPYYLRAGKNGGCHAEVAGRPCKLRAHLPQERPLYCAVHHRIFRELTLIE